MQFSDCRVGMEVIFGRGNGEQTRGIIEKMNKVKAKVRTIENRGKTTSGTVWSVPYSLMTTANGTYNPPAPQPKLKYSPFQDSVEVLILEAINIIYNGLSPESLTCDGEAPLSLVNSKRAKLNRQLRGLFQVLGREVDETTAFNWFQEKREYERNRQVYNYVNEKT